MLYAGISTTHAYQKKFTLSEYIVSANVVVINNAGNKVIAITLKILSIFI